jgi:hypothetical protein
VLKNKGMIVRRCCTYDCGTGDGLQNYEGRTPAYFCSKDLCNDVLSDGNLPKETIDPFSTTSALLTTNDGMVIRNNKISNLIHFKTSLTWNAELL